MSQIAPYRYLMTHKGDGQNVLHIDGDVQWYDRMTTMNPNDWYAGVPNVTVNFDCVDEY